MHSVQLYNIVEIIIASKLLIVAMPTLKVSASLGILCCGTGIGRVLGSGCDFDLLVASSGLEKATWIDDLSWDGRDGFPGNGGW